MGNDASETAVNQSDSGNQDSEAKAFLWIERIVRKRFGILLLLALVCWPLLGFVPALESLVANGLLLDRYSQIAFLTLTNVVAFYFSFSILRLLNSRIVGGRWLQWIAGDGNAPWSRSRMQAVLLFALVAPAILAFQFGTELPPDGHWWRSIVAIALGAAAAIAGLIVIGWLKSKLVGSQKDTANYFPFEARTSVGIIPWDKFSSKLDVLRVLGIESIDLQFLIYLILLGVGHGGIIRWLESDFYWLTSAPSMLVMLIWLPFMALAGIANVLDRWRIPSLIVILLILAVVLWFHGSTRVLRTFEDRAENHFVSRIAKVRQQENELLDRGGSMQDRIDLIAAETASLEKDAWQAVASRMERLETIENGKGKTLVVVTCPGGGIHAAAWAACVLDQLSQEYEEFKDSVCVISGVSGGSVGTLMFVSNRYHNELLDQRLMGAPPPTTDETHRDLKEKSPALELAARSSLEAIAFGISVDDLYGLVGIPGTGRGQRLEDSFTSRLPDEQRELTMGDWGDRALIGTVPIVVFNSTDAVTGRRILFDTVPTPRRSSSVGLTARPLNYRELLATETQPFDVRPATAARTSATFPYVSPFTKPEQSSSVGKSVAICDGGYVDNEGIVTAVNWIEFFLKRWVAEAQETKTFDRILLLRIQPSASVDQNQIPGAGGIAGGFRWLTGPIEAMAKVRSASQLERGNLESDLAALYLDASEALPEPSTATMAAPERSFGDSLSDTKSDSMPYIPEFDPRKQQPIEIRKNWEKMLTDFEARGSQQMLAPPSFEATFDNQTRDKEGEAPVIVQTIAFVDANQVIPLNWKLSNRQKQGYLLAWRLCSAADTQLRRTLDRYFTRRSE
ncbi:patatin-like phospholipase family protein [Rhodopirellula sp. JC639]|uniref:patatin-like phospholipase family protein n=1 Tax=Stieleria mannarensis TaxID=2755585 RepID=UPI0015FEDE45|nr:patatin-like phospholipase family protein [Rhodopirellula sp. JC639]